MPLSRCSGSGAFARACEWRQRRVVMRRHARHRTVTSMVFPHVIRNVLMARGIEHMVRVKSGPQEVCGVSAQGVVLHVRPHVNAHVHWYNPNMCRAVRATGGWQRLRECCTRSLSCRCDRRSSAGAIAIGWTESLHAIGCDVFHHFPPDRSLATPAVRSLLQALRTHWQLLARAWSAAKGSDTSLMTSSNSHGCQ